VLSGEIQAKEFQWLRRRIRVLIALKMCDRQRRFVLTAEVESEVEMANA
jgi:hypothetical protein